MVEDSSNVVPLRQPEAEISAPSGEIILFPGTMIAARAIKANGASKRRRRWSRVRVGAIVLLVTVVLTPRYWLAWAAHFGPLTAIITGGVVGLTALLIFDELLNKYHYFLIALFVVFIVSAFYIPFMIPTAIMCTLLIAIRRNMK
jgi:hypothetical protein